MKSEERHELKENDLAGWIYSVPAFLSRYGSYLLFALVLALLGFNLYRWYSSEQEKKVQKAWSELADAAEAENPPFKYNAVATQSEVRGVQALAYLNIGNYYLECLTLGGTPKNNPGVKYSADMADRESEKAFQKVLSDYTDQPLTCARAHLGLGLLYEDRHEWDRARREYELLTAKSGPYATIPVASVAQDRLDHLAEWSEPVTFGPPLVIPTTASSRPADSHGLNNSLPGGSLDLPPSFLPGGGSMSPFGGGIPVPPMPSMPPATGPSP